MILNYLAQVSFSATDSHRLLKNPSNLFNLWQKTGSNAKVIKSKINP